jgi:hypothetical protein
MQGSGVWVRHFMCATGRLCCCRVLCVTVVLARVCVAVYSEGADISYHHDVHFIHFIRFECSYTNSLIHEASHTRVC